MFNTSNRYYLYIFLDSGTIAPDFTKSLQHVSSILYMHMCSIYNRFIVQRTQDDINLTSYFPSRVCRIVVSLLDIGPDVFIIVSEISIYK